MDKTTNSVAIQRDKVSVPKFRPGYKPGENGCPLITSLQREACLKVMGHIVADYYSEIIEKGKPLVVCSILYGGMHFGVDLAGECGKQSDGKSHGRREYNRTLSVRELSLYISRYDGQQRHKPTVNATLFYPEQIRGLQLLLVDEICESGSTLEMAREHISK